MDNAALMNAYCEGDEAAFRALYAAIAPRLLAYLRNLVRDRALADDLLQQTFLKLHAARASYLRGADPLPWLFAIAHRTTIDELRRRCRSRVRAVADVPDVAVGHDGVRDEERYEEREVTVSAIDLAAAVDELPEAYRMAFVLTKREGMSCASAAAVLGTTAGAVKLRVHRAYAKLRAILGTPEAEPDEAPEPERREAM
jgi:RNA polymerase sigma-70 factor (ECF subfamily)